MIARLCLAGLALAACVEKETLESAGTTGGSGGSSPMGGGSGGGGSGGGQGLPDPATLDPNLGLTWSRVSTGTTENLWELTWTGSRLFAFGSGGTVLSSADGTSWTPVSTGTDATFTFVLSTGARLVALDTKHQILTSENGGAWTVRFSKPDLPMVVLGKVGATFVALGATEDDYWATSQNGVDWTVHHDPNLSSAFFSSCASGQRLVCVGWRNGFNVSQGIAFATNDGLSWKEVSPDFAVAPMRGVAWKGKDLMAVGELGSVFLSPDGEGWLYKDSWAPLDTPGGNEVADALAWTGKLAVIVGGSYLLTSKTAHPYDWQRQSVEAAGHAIAFTGKRLIVVGENGDAFVSP